MEANKRSILLGISDSAQTGVYKTTYYPYQTIDYMNWYDGPAAESYERCVLMMDQEGYKYVPASCEYKDNFVCAYDLDLENKYGD